MRSSRNEAGKTAGRASSPAKSPGRFDLTPQISNELRSERQLPIERKYFRIPGNIFRQEQSGEANRKSLTEDGPNNAGLCRPVNQSE